MGLVVVVVGVLVSVVVVTGPGGGAGVVGMKQRSSDPNVQHGEVGQIFFDPNTIPDLPMGSPDTVFN